MIRKMPETKRPGVKRFYKNVDILAVEHGFALMLDGFEAKTPQKKPYFLPSATLAALIAEEWRVQGTILEPMSMPLTRLAHTALDGVAHRLEATREDLARYAETDLVCYRASEPESLVAAQSSAFDPVLTFARTELGAHFHVAKGLMPISQPPQTCNAVKVTLPHEPFAVTAFHVLTSLSGSILLTLMLARGALTPQEAWHIAHVEEDFQSTRWGRDAQAQQRQQARWRDYEAAAHMFAAL